MNVIDRMELKGNGRRGARSIRPVVRSLRTEKARHRTEADYALAARMLLKMRQGEDVRLDRVETARGEIAEGLMDGNAKLSRALDILIDEFLEDADAEGRA